MIEFIEENFTIVLVRPSHAGNIGAAARAMKNMGFSRLRIVAPGCDPIGAESLRMAYGAQELLTSAQVFSTLLESIRNSPFVVGMTGHPFRRYEAPIPLPQAAPEVIARGRRHPVALLFGSEGAGLTSGEIALCHRLVTIPTPGPHASLNLSQAVMVVLYELIRGLPGTTTPVPENPASVEEMEHLYQAWTELLHRSRMIRERQGQSMLTRLRRIFSRSSLSPEEARMIQGILRQAVWQLEHPKETRKMTGPDE